MPLLWWIVLGLVVGIAGSRILNKTESGFSLDLAVAISGAIVGGLLFDAVLQRSTVGMNPWSLSVAAIGSAGVLWVWHAFVRNA